MHLSSGFAIGTGSTNVLFTFDVNSGATRTGMFTIAGETLTVTQAGTNHIATTLVTTLVSSGLSSPTSIAADAAGNVYFTDRNNNAIKKWTAANNTVSTIVSTGLSLPYAVAIDAAGNLYIADSGNHAIKKWTATNNIATTLVATGLNNPCGVAVDADGNIFISDTENHAIKRLAVNDTNIVTLVSSGLNRPFGIATDIAGNVFIADFANNAIKKWTAASSNVTTLVSSGLNSPAGVAVDGAGNVYIANTSGQNIRKWTAASGLITTIISSGLVSPNGVAVDNAGNVYIANTGNNTIREMPRAFVDTTTRIEPAVGGSDTLLVALPTSVNLLTPFAPISSQPWLTLGAASNGSVAINFTNNFSNARNANLTVLGLTVPITQSAPAFILATNNAFVGAAPGTNSVALVTLPEGAAWTATNNAAWLHLVSGFTNGIGSTNIIYTFDVNPGTQRVGTLTVAGQTFTVTQAAPPLPEIGVEQPAGVNLIDGNATNNFANGYVGFTNSINTFVITNSGTTNLAGLAITKDGANASDFIVSNIGSANLAPNASTTFTVSFAPNAIGNRTAAIHIANSDPDENPFDIALVGFGIAPSNTLSSTSLFVSFVAGSSNVALTVTPEIANWTATANAPWLQLSAPNQNGTGSANISFTFDANPGAQRIGTLTIGGQTLTVTQAALPVPEIGVEQPAGVNLIDGNATNNFANGYVGFTNTINAFVITNSGTTNLTGLAITKDGANAGDFIVSSIGSVNLAPNASTTFTVSFAPSATGSRIAAIHIASNDSDENPFDIALTGFGIAPSNTLSSATRSVGFAAGSDSVTLTTFPSIANWTATANAPWLQLSAPNQSGTGSTNITFTFDANLGAQRVGTLTIGGQTFTVTQASLPVPEIGVEQPAGANLTDGSATNNLGNGYVGFTNLINTFTITNSGTTNLTGLVITKDGANAGDFIVNTIGSATLSPNASTTFTVSFAPSATGSRIAAIHIASNDTDENPFDIALTGFGVAPSNTLSSATRSVGFAAGSDSVTLTTFPSIANWTATANAAWLHLSAANASGTGSTNITFTFDANLGAQRVGTLTIGGQTLTVTQAGLPTPEIGVQQPVGNNLTDGTSTNNFGNSYLSITNTINTFVITNSGTTNLTGLAITKDGANAADFIVSSIGSPTLSPNASTTFTVSFAPTAAGNRTAAIHIASNDSDENPFDITLNGVGVAPIYSLSTTTSSVPYQAGSSNVALTVIPESAAWTATANSPWLHLSAANQSGIGSTNLVFTYDINPGTTRIGTLTIGGQTLTVTQTALPFTAALGTTNIAEDPAAGSDSIVLFVIPGTGSNWTATADSAWLHLSAPNQSGNSSANIIFTFDANTGSTRTGTLTIAGQTLSITQGGTNVLSAGSLTTLAASGFNQPKGIAVDSAGNLYIADTSNNAIKKWSRTNNTVTTLISGLNQPSGVAVDVAGNLFVADTQNFAIKKWTASNSVVSTVVSSGLNRPAGVAVDKAGNLYIADTFNNAIKKWTATNNTLTTLVSSGLDLPNGVAVDAAGNVYIADTFFNSVKKWTAANQTVSTVISSGLIQPHGVAVDTSGNIYVTDTFNHAIKKWTATTSSVTTIISGLNLPKGIAADEFGNVHIADTSNNQIKELPRAFVDTSPRTINTPASTNSQLLALPAGVNLLPPFAPTSSQAWLTINSVSNGLITLAVTANTGASRTATLTVLNRTIPITQVLTATPTTLSYSKIVAGLALSFAANPGQIYQIESAPTVTGPWITNTSLVGAAGGFLSYTNPISTVSNRFFRTRTP